MPARLSRDNGASDAEAEFLIQMEEALKIDETSLERCLFEQPEIFYRVAKAAALAISKRDALKKTIEEVEAEAELAIRADAETRITADEVKARKRVSPSVVSVVENYNAMTKKASVLNALKEAFTQRQFMLKELVALYLANYYSDTPSRSMQQTRDIDSDAAKRAMLKARKERLADRGD